LTDAAAGKHFDHAFRTLTVIKHVDLWRYCNANLFLIVIYGEMIIITACGAVVRDWCLCECW